MEQILDIIKKRASVRTYDVKPVPEELINSLLEAARYAPSARNLQQLEYKVITNKDFIKKLSDGIAGVLKNESPSFPARPSFFYGAPLLIIITGPKENLWASSDAALAAQNIMLTATENDLGTCFIGMAKFIERDKALLDELRISPDRNISAAIVCGYAAEKPPVKEKAINAEFFK
jgi:nitroreductase